jgi:hypothetical protein
VFLQALIDRGVAGNTSPINTDYGALVPELDTRSNDGLQPHAPRQTMMGHHAVDARVCEGGLLPPTGVRVGPLTAGPTRTVLVEGRELRALF